jgi:hypothetical protein
VQADGYIWGSQHAGPWPLRMTVHAVLRTHAQLVRLLPKPPLHVQLGYIKFRLAALGAHSYLGLCKRYPDSARYPRFAGLTNSWTFE